MYIYIYLESHIQNMTKEGTDVTKPLKPKEQSIEGNLNLND